MEILIISGLSGGGKSKAASFLEDMGFYIVDNIPAGLIMKFAEFCAAGSNRYSRVALVYDVRTSDTFDEFLEVLNTLRQQKYNCRLLFLEAEVDAIIKRYKETRRRHPLRDSADSLEAAVRRERELMEPVKEYITMVVLLLGSIPLMYFLNGEWYHTLMFTEFGKILLAVCGGVIFVSVAVSLTASPSA